MEIRSRALLVACIVALVGISWTKDSEPARKMPCWYQDSNSGYTFDLSSLMKSDGDYEKAGKVISSDGGGTRRFLFNICQDINEWKCDQKRSPSIREEQDSSCVILGDLDQHKWSLLNNDDPTEGVALTYSGGDSCEESDGQRTTKLKFKCNSDVSLRVVKAHDTTSCSSEIEMESSYACPISNGLSWGWIMIILFILAVGGYLGVGIFYNIKKRDLKGVEAIPNLEFWREVPYYVKEGCEFSAFKAKEGYERFQEWNEKRKYQQANTGSANI